MCASVINSTLSKTALIFSFQFSFNFNFIKYWASLVAQLVKNLSAMWETWIWSLGWEDTLEKWKANHSSILAWRIPWTQEPSRLQFLELQRVGHDWATFKKEKSLHQMFSEHAWGPRPTRLSLSLVYESWSRHTHLGASVSSLLHNGYKVINPGKLIAVAVV